jgi:hypothetical protein
LFRLREALQGGQSRMARPTTLEPLRVQKQMRAEARETSIQILTNMKRRDPSQNRSGKEKTQPNINKHQTTGSVAKSSRREKTQPNINRHQTTVFVAKQIRKGKDQTKYQQTGSFAKSSRREKIQPNISKHQTTVSVAKQIQTNINRHQATGS